MQGGVPGLEGANLVSITLRCFCCRAEQEIRVPRERGISSGKYIWECFACQGKRQDNIGNEPSEQEDA